MTDDTNTFTSRDGKEIGLIPGWFERKNAWPAECRSFEAYAERVGTGGTAFSSDFQHFLNRLLFAGYARAFLEQRLVALPGTGPMLDICTGDAVLPRAFKALGLCAEAHGIDVEEIEPLCSDEDMAASWERARSLVANEEAAPLHEYIDDIDLNNVGTIIYGDFDADRIGMDSHTVADIVRDPPDRNFPLMTLVDALPRFEIGALFEALAGSLQPGGILFTCNRYFFDIWAGKHLPMDAPWIHARLSGEELRDYYAAVRPELVGHVDKVHTDKSTHLTPEDYREAAEKHGLELLAYERTINRSDLRPLVFEDASLAGLLYGEVLPQCQAVNPRVTMEDLFTAVLTMLFRKRA